MKARRRHDQGTPPAAIAPPLLTALAQLPSHNHLCSIYDSPEEQLAVAVPFVRIGLERGEKCLYIADDETEASVREALAAEGLDVDQAIATHRLMITTKQAAYLNRGSFDPDWMLRFWAAASAEATRQGFSALRGAGETAWVLREVSGFEQWIEYECRVTHLVARHNCQLLCLYNLRQIPASLARDIIRTHPIVIHRGVACRNMYHVPPD